MRRLSASVTLLQGQGSRGITRKQNPVIQQAPSSRGRHRATPAKVHVIHILFEKKKCVPKNHNLT
jgi:hypothetical protein